MENVTLGKMMNYQLTIPAMLERAGRLFSKMEIVSRMPDKSLHRQTYADFYRRARALSEALQKAGLKRGERVGTLMWNHYAHHEAYFGIPSAGGVYHTLNLRLSPNDLTFIINQAQDRFIIVDDVLLPLYMKVKDQVKVEKVIVVPLTGQPVPEGFESYETFLSTATGNFKYPDLDENEACGMCYTSGTTGNPKGVLYSHRAIVLHTLVSLMSDGLAFSQADSICPVVPMFHVNAWGFPFTATIVGAKQVYPGPHLDPASLLDLFAREEVTLTAGVPTIWLGILQALMQNPTGWKLTPQMRMVVGGSAAPESMIKAFDQFGLHIVHAWGMTEMTPLGTVSTLKSYLKDLPEEEQYAFRSTQGMPSPFIELRLMNEQGEVPCDGKSIGELQVRGPWVASGYFDATDSPEKWTSDGWFGTGDVASIDAEGYMKITDRTKDLIKSGGEWISSVDLENFLMGHPAVAEAAVIAVAHPKWQERPLAVVVFKQGQSASQDDLRTFLSTKFPSWWLPDGFVFLTEPLPRTTTGKFLKKALREKFHDYSMP